MCFIKMNEYSENGELDVSLAERIQLGQFDPMYRSDISNSRYAEFLDWHFHHDVVGIGSPTDFEANIFEDEEEDIWVE